MGSVKTSLDHLLERKRVELARVVNLILERVQPEMIILFGFPRPRRLVEELTDDGFHYKYQSHYDILVIVDDPASPNLPHMRCN